MTAIFKVKITKKKTLKFDLIFQARKTRAIFESTFWSWVEDLKCKVEGKKSRVKSRGSEKFEIIFSCVYTDSSRCLAMFNDVFTLCIYIRIRIYVPYANYQILTETKLL